MYKYLQTQTTSTATDVRETMSSYCKDTLAAEVVVSDVCNDIDRVAVFRSSPSSLEACPFVASDHGFEETDHDLREYPALQAVVAGQIEAGHSITWHVPAVELRL